MGINEDCFEPSVSSIGPHPIRVDSPKVRKPSGNSILSDLLQALGASILGHTCGSLSTSRDRTRFSGAPSPDSDSHNHKALLCSVSKASCSIKSGRLVNSQDHWISSPLDYFLSHNLFHEGSGWFFPCLRHMLVCTHFSSETSIICIESNC